MLSYLPSPLDFPSHLVILLPPLHFALALSWNKGVVFGPACPFRPPHRDLLSLEFGVFFFFTRSSVPHTFFFSFIQVLRFSIVLCFPPLTTVRFSPLPSAGCASPPRDALRYYFLLDVRPNFFSSLGRLCFKVLDLLQGRAPLFFSPLSQVGA